MKALFDPQKSAGFTLIELLIVTGIIAVLAAIAVPQYSSHREKGIRTSMISDARNTATNLEAVFDDCRTYPPITVPAGGVQTLLLNSLAGDCAAMPADATITFAASKGNSIANAGDAESYSITITNPAAGAGYNPLTLKGGVTGAASSCSFANGTGC